MEALALSKEPLTAYHVARLYNMNVAKVYLEMKRLGRLGLVKSSGRNRGIEYVLADVNLRKLALKLSSRVQTYESWRSEESRRARFMMGLVSIPPALLEAKPNTVKAGRHRMPGELENLAVLGRKKFDRKYRRVSGRDYDRV